MLQGVQAVTSDVHISDIDVHYGSFQALANINLSIRSGEFVTLLGPSGSGKSTLLMTLAGFVKPTKGSVRIGNRELLTVSPEKRKFGVVFQGYALFPHLTVEENVAFPLRVRGVSRAESIERVRKTLDLVQLTDFRQRKPSELSGGQQQRVAIARALVFGPTLVLLDEPMSALDRQLREQMQHELKELHHRVGCTFIMVTHDQSEALAMSDRIAVMDDGRILQVGTPVEIYRRPRSRFVAEFIGKNNIFGCRIGKSTGSVIAVETAFGTIELPADQQTMPPGCEALLAVRPEHLSVPRNGAANGSMIEGFVRDVSFHGGIARIRIDSERAGEIISDMDADEASEIMPGERVELSFQPKNAVIIPSES